MTVSMMSRLTLLGCLGLGAVPAVATAEVHRVFPTTHSRLFTAAANPVARIRSGDTVITRTGTPADRITRTCGICSIPTSIPRPATR
jgi:hypothetical protein